MTQIPLVLVPGAALGPWAFADIVPLLADRGYDVHTPYLSGVAPCDEYEARDITASDWAEDLADYLATEHLNQATFIAHDVAGLAMGPLVASYPELVTQIVFSEAMVPVPGDTGWAALLPAIREAWQQQLGADGQGWLPWFNEAKLAELYPEDPLPQATQEWVASHGLGLPIGVLHQVQPYPEYAAEGIELHFLYPESSPVWERKPPLPSGHRTFAPAGQWPMLSDPTGYVEQLCTALSSRIPGQRSTATREPVEQP